jgi:hypothetical protein
VLDFSLIPQFLFPNNELNFHLELAAVANRKSSDDESQFAVEYSQLIYEISSLTTPLL